MHVKMHIFHGLWNNKRENNGEQNRTIDSEKKINALSGAVLHLMSVCRYF